MREASDAAQIIDQGRAVTALGQNQQILQSVLKQSGKKTGIPGQRRRIIDRFKETFSNDQTFSSEAKKVQSGRRLRDHLSSSNENSPEKMVYQTKSRGEIKRALMSNVSVRLDSREVPNNEDICGL